jgi:hypothetical protein
MEFATMLPWISLFVGLVARIFVPWLAKRREEDPPTKWEWKFVWPQLMAVAIIFLLLPLLISDLEAVQNLPFQAAWLAGWAAADIGRETYKALAKEED